MLIAFASALLPAAEVEAELDKNRGLKILLEVAVEKIMKANREQK